MNKRQWFIIIALAIVGYATLPILFSRYDPSSKWGYELERQRDDDEPLTFVHALSPAEFFS